MDKTINCYKCGKEGDAWEVGEDEWFALGFIEAGGDWLCLKCDKHRCESCDAIVGSREDRLCDWCEENDVENHPKDHCVCCDRAIEKSVKHHRKYGNYCRMCSGKAGRIIDIDSSIRLIEAKLTDLEGGYKVTKLKRKIEKLKIKRDAIINSLPQYAELSFRTFESLQD